MSLFTQLVSAGMEEDKRRRQQGMLSKAADDGTVGAIASSVSQRPLAQNILSGLQRQGEDHARRPEQPLTALPSSASSGGGSGGDILSLIIKMFAGA